MLSVEQELRYVMDLAMMEVQPPWYVRGLIPTFVTNW